MFNAETEGQCYCDGIGPQPHPNSIEVSCEAASAEALARWRELGKMGRGDHMSRLGRRR